MDQELAELINILGWLPELAADSPMKKVEWDQVHSASEELLTEFQRVDSMARNAPHGKWHPDAKCMEALETTLSRLVASSLDAKPVDRRKDRGS